MSNQIITNPRFEDIYDADFRRFMEHSVIHIKERDVKDFVKDAKSVVVLEGKSRGENRMERAINDAVSHLGEIANGSKLEDVDRFLFLCAFGKEHPLLIAEMEAVNNLVESAGSDKDFLWGLAELPECKDDTITIKMMLAFK